jgi:hypothetical protein
MHLPNLTPTRRLALSAFGTLWLGVNIVAAEPQQADGGASPVNLALKASLDAMGLVLGGSMPDSLSRSSLCANKQRGLLALDPAHPSLLVWTRCLPADCQDVQNLPGACWLRGVDGGARQFGYARDHVEIVGPPRIEFAGQGDSEGLAPELISLRSVPLGRGREGLLISTKYPGTNHTLLQCLLSYSGGTYRCLPTPELDDEVKAVTPTGIQRVEEFGMTPVPDGLLMIYGVYLNGDANCCPCATIEAKLRPGPDALHVSSLRLLPSPDDKDCRAKFTRTGAGPRDSALAAMRQARAALDSARSQHDQADAWFDLQIAAIAFGQTNGPLTFDMSPSTPAAQRAASASALGIEVARCDPANIWTARTTGYERYLEFWPDGPRADEAAWQSRVWRWCGDFEASVEEWEDLLSRLSTFLTDFPRSRHAPEAAQLALEARARVALARAAADGGTR